MHLHVPILSYAMILIPKWYKSVFFFSLFHLQLYCWPHHAYYFTFDFSSVYPSTGFLPLLLELPPPVLRLVLGALLLGAADSLFYFSYVSLITSTLCSMLHLLWIVERYSFFSYLSALITCLHGKPTYWPYLQLQIQSFPTRYLYLPKLKVWVPSKFFSKSFSILNASVYSIRNLFRVLGLSFFLSAIKNLSLKYFSMSN